VEKQTRWRCGKMRLGSHSCLLLYRIKKKKTERDIYFYFRKRFEVLDKSQDSSSSSIFYPSNKMETPPTPEPILTLFWGEKLKNSSPSASSKGALYFSKSFQ
jgi:hypothetical protein